MPFYEPMKVTGLNFRAQAKKKLKAKDINHYPETHSLPEFLSGTEEVAQLNAHFSFWYTVTIAPE